MTKTYNQHNSCLSPEYGVRDYGPTDKQSSRSGFRVAAAVISLLAVFALFLCAPAGAALSADVQGDALPDTLFEGEKVSYQLVITGIPSQAKTLELSTDLRPSSNGKSLWTPSTEGLSNPPSNEQSIRITAAEGFPSTIMMEVNGYVKPIRGEVPIGVEGVKIFTISNKDRESFYYCIEALDAEGKTLEYPVKKSLKILVKDEESFKESADTVSDEKFKTLIVEMYDKGLTEEAKSLLDWYGKQPVSVMSIFVPIIVGVIALILGAAAGFIVGVRRGSGED